MLSKNHPVILFIDRFGFGVYQDTLANIPKFSFTPDIVANLDVVNKDNFVSLISTFIQINKMVPSSLAVILSDNVIYIKDLANPVQRSIPVQDLKADSDGNKDDHGDELQSFLENIPFEEILAKVIKVGGINRAVAVNKDLVMTIVNTFAIKGFTIEGIIPGFMYGQNANFTIGLTSDNVRVILEDAETLRSGNLLTDQEKTITSQNLGSELKNVSINGTKKPQNFRQYILIGVFVTLLVILGVVYLNLGASQTPPVKKANNPVSVVSIPTIPPVDEPTSIQELTTIVPIDLETINIKILHSVQSEEIAVDLKSGLSGIGFRNVLGEISEVSIPEKSSVIFSQSIPANLRNNLIIEIKKILPDISILESQDSNFTVNILIGKS